MYDFGKKPLENEETDWWTYGGYKNRFERIPGDLDIMTLNGRFLNRGIAFFGSSSLVKVNKIDMAFLPVI
ncbi:hypothetical protein [Neobacillus soli]|uniref:hypothetical protein n=1 Tax=Neobacillus soli TaxID=220688 RepID=UPI001155EDD0|nr:hypothetical protein [Neobacillus soli]